MNDFAINGAVPAFGGILHVGRPNMAERTVFNQYVDRIYEAGWLTNNGPLLLEFEKKVASYLDVKHCVSMCNGTVALEIAIRALGIEKEVIVPSFTFIATAHALQWQGIKPIFADIDPKTHNLDPSSVESMITPETTGIIGVHLWGRPSAIDELKSLADNYGLKLMFDAAHAFGCKFREVSIGNFGECEILSFHATKFFNTFEGGAVVTNNDELAEKLRIMRNFGFVGYDDVKHLGINGKMTEIHAAMGLSNFEILDHVLDENKRNYKAYINHLDGFFGLELLKYDEKEKGNYQYIVFELNDEAPFTRDKLVAMLQAENVIARKYFWPGCHRMSPYKEQNAAHNQALQFTERVSDRVVVMPTGSSVSEHDIKEIAFLIEKYHKFLS